MTITINGTTGIAGVDGSAGTPSYQGNDTNTGVFFPAADTIAFAEGGVEVARFDSAGNLGLGVTPSAWSGATGFQLANGAFVGAAGRYFYMGANTYFNGSWRYTTSSGGAARYDMDGSHAWFVAPSGTAGNAISFTQAMTLDASGNLGVGSTNPNAPLDVKSASGGNAVTIRARNGNDYSFIVFRQSDGSEDLGGIANLRTAANTGNLLFYTAGGAAAGERARIDSSGNLLVGTTTYNGASNTAGAGINPVGQIAVERGAGAAAVFNRFTSDGNLVIFRRQGTTVGSIDVTTTATSYVTSSDYRLKEDVQPMTGALAKVQALKPCTYKWKIDGSDGEGFIAHELAEVCPHAVTGEKDAVETYTDEEGNEQTRPVYQGIDTSFLVATLTAAIQEQQAIIEQLTTRIAALEAK